MDKIEIRTEVHELLLGKFVKRNGVLYIEYKSKGKLDYIAWNTLSEQASVFDK